MNIRKRVFICVLAVLLFVVLGGSIFKPADMALNVEEKIVYQNDSAEFFLVRAAANKDAARGRYHNSYFVLTGVLRSRMDDNKNFYLGAASTVTTDTLYCIAYNEEASVELSKLTVGNLVKVYGRFTHNALTNKWTMTVDKIEKTEDQTVSTTAYSLADGMTFDREEMCERELQGGKVRYWIPADWEAVEKDLIKTNLGTMEGYQYCLNEIGQQSVQPESLFVCYFDCDRHLLRSGDKSETELVEKAIVKNILKREPGSASQRKMTYYGAAYHYYQNKFETQLGQSYRTEFVFQPVGTDGFVVYLYVYLEKAHLDGVMTVMRLLEVD